MEYEETSIVKQQQQDRLREIGRLVEDDGLATNLPGVERWVEVVGGRLPRPRLTPPATRPASPITTSAAFPPRPPRTSDPGGRWLATRRFINDDGEITAVMGQPPLGPPPLIYGRRWVALEPEGSLWVSDDQDYEEYTADTGTGLVVDAALQESFRPLGVLTPDGRLIRRG